MIAEALEAAHEKDIIHRDQKPSNVMLTSKGQAKVVAPGLAKAFSANSSNGSTGDASQLPAMSAQSTAAGVHVQ